MAWPAVCLAVYALKKACDMVVHFTGAEKEITNTDKHQQEVLKGIDKKLENLDEDISNKVKEHLGSNLTPREKQEKLEAIKQMSKAEKAELLKELKDANVAEQQAINKALQEKLEKQEKTNIQMAEQLKNARDNGDSKGMAKFAQMMKDNDRNQQTTRLQIRENEKKMKEQEKEIVGFFKEIEKNKPWYLDMNFKSPWLWGLLLMSCVIFYFLYKALMSSWNKIKELFFSSE